MDNIQRPHRITSNPNIKDEKVVDAFPHFKRKFHRSQNKAYGEVLGELFGLKGSALNEAIFYERISVAGRGKLHSADVEPGTGNAGARGEKNVWSTSAPFETIYVDDLNKYCETGKTFRYVVDESLTAEYKY